MRWKGRRVLDAGGCGFGYGSCLLFSPSVGYLVGLFFLAGRIMGLGCGFDVVERM